MSQIDHKFEQLAVNTIRFLAIDAIEKANSGHPGLPMGMADCAFVLFDKYLRHDPSDPKWMGRDRFILSAGHGSMLLYSLLHLSGYDLSLDDLKDFRQWESRTPGHPEYGHTTGVETTTGPLGQGFANGVGMAIASKWFRQQVSCELFDTRIFAIVSDGDLMEGISAEAASIAGHLGLGNLIYIYDDNGISIEGSTNLTFTEDVAKRFEAYNWHVQKIDGHDREQIARALENAICETNKPSIICAKTHIGYGSPQKQDTASCHGSPLGEAEVLATKKNLGWPEDRQFYIPPEVSDLFEKRKITLKQARTEWNTNFNKWIDEHPVQAKLYRNLLVYKLPTNLSEELIDAAGGEAKASRVLSGNVLERACEIMPGLIGGSADLAPSNKTFIKAYPVIGKDRFEGRNIHFGIREHAMGAILNGMAQYGGIIPYGGTFLVFSDYMRASIRLAAMMHLRVIYVFTHDSIFVGEDGPTHQPVEHLCALRAIPNLHVMRPADPQETAIAWKAALEYQGPTALILSRQKLPLFEREINFVPEDVQRGAYVLQPGGNKKALVIATGSEVYPSMQAAKKLNLRVISMPCIELFLKQSPDFQHQIIPPDYKIAVVEASYDPSWYRLAGRNGLLIGMKGYGASAPSSILADKFGFSEEKIFEQLSSWLEQISNSTLKS